MEAYSRLIPAPLKQKLKPRLMAALHAAPEINARIATRVVRDGVPRYLRWSFASERENTLRYLESVRVGTYGYQFAASARSPTLYGSVYACMLLGMYGELDDADRSFKDMWLAYLDRYQDEADGYFRDPSLAGPAFNGTPAWGDGWGIRHLAAHVVIAYARLGRAPAHRFRFLEPYYDAKHLERWLDSFDFTGNVWSQSNYVMNVYTLLQYARDFMAEHRAARPLLAIEDWLLSTQRPDTGMWHDYAVLGYPELGDAIRGAYHFYPLLSYEERPIPRPEAVIDTILRAQNSWGGFNPEQQPSGACEDIDAIDPLIRTALQTEHRRRDVEEALRRAMLWILSCRHPEGGYESVPEHGWSYGGHPLTSSRPREANLFATWFRTLCLAYVVDYLGLTHSFRLGNYPGYEIRLARGVAR